MSEVSVIHLPCGNQAFMADYEYGYTCENCLCVVGSMGQPKECAELQEKYHLLRALGTNIRWDYDLGKEVRGE